MLYIQLYSGAVKLQIILLQIQIIVHGHDMGPTTIMQQVYLEGILQWRVLTLHANSGLIQAIVPSTNMKNRQVT